MRWIGLLLTGTVIGGIGVFMVIENYSGLPLILGLGMILSSTVGIIFSGAGPVEHSS